MREISSIEQLIHCFEDTECSEQIGVLKEVNIAPSEFEKHATWKAGGYTRNCLARRDAFEFILLCWEKGAKTPIHDHGGQDCWVYQVSGTALEKRYTGSEEHFEPSNSITLEAGKLTYMNDRMGFHSIENLSDGRAMTLHIYAKPIDRCQVFDDTTGTFELREMKYDSMKEGATEVVKIRG